MLPTQSVEPSLELLKNCFVEILFYKNFNRFSLIVYHIHFKVTQSFNKLMHVFWFQITHVEIYTLSHAEPRQLCL